MPLRKFTDEEFDNLVRTKFESAPTPTYDPAAWSKFAMQKQKAVWLPKVIYSGVILILIILGSLFVLNKTNTASDLLSTDEIHANQNSKAEKSDAIVGANNRASIVDSKVVGVNNEQNKVLEETKNESDLSENKGSVVSNSTVSKLRNNNERVSTVEDTKVLTTGAVANSISSNSKSNSTSRRDQSSSQVTILAQEENVNESIDKTNNSDFNDQGNIETLSDETKNIVDDQTITIGTDERELAPALVLVQSFGDGHKNGDDILPKQYQEEPYILLANPEEVQYQEPPIAPTNTGPLKNRLTLGLLLNGDLTTVNLNNFTGPGTGIGIRAEYQMFNRLSIVSGVNRVKKVYLVTDEGDVTLPAGVWDNNNFPDQIDAECTVIEIPINVKLDLIRFRKGKIYGLAGLNSFLMNRELYAWDISQGQYSTTTENIDIQGENKHYFGVLNLSAGYQHRVSNHFSWGVETYYQSTLAGVGFYEIGLKSIGNQILLNYHF